MKKICFTALLSIVLIVTLMSIVQAQPTNPQETLNQYISDLQKNPNDNALREKIIKHVQTMQPAPAIPEEARRHYVMGKTLFEDAKNVQDFKDAIEKFKKALLIAPWWSDAYRDIGMALEAAQQYDEAIAALKLYLATNPGDEYARRGQNEIYKIEAKKEKASKARADELNAGAETAKAKKKGMQDLVGNWYVTNAKLYGHYRAEMRGDELWILGVCDKPVFKGEYVGRTVPFYIVTNLDGTRLVGRFVDPADKDIGYLKTMEVSDDFRTMRWVLSDQTWQLQK